ncbi:MAG: hypothetical protein IBX61_02435 [Thermoleophilia bacterium]|nr:hypothetical protein [Thermoleophilia bacterium]
MRTKRKKHNRKVMFTLIAVLFVALATLTSAMVADQSAAAQTVPESFPPGSVTDLKTVIIEVNLIFDYEIPSEAELAEIRKEAKKSREYKAMEKQLGKEKAEK